MGRRVSKKEGRKERKKITIFVLVDETEGIFVYTPTL